MLNILLTVHIIISCLIIVFILLNKGKGADMGVAFSNSNVDMINFNGSNSILKKIIIILAILILISSLSINVVNKKINNSKDNPIVNIIEK